LKSKRYFLLITVLVVLSTLSMLGLVAAQATIDFSGITSPSTTDVARYDLDDENKETNPNIGTEFTTAMYGSISSLDDTYAVTRVQHTYDYAQQIFKFKVAVPISEFTLAWEGNIAFAQIGDPHTEGIEIWNKAINSWEWLGTVSQVGDFDANPPAPPVGASVQGTMLFMVADEAISGTYYGTEVNDYIDNGYISLMVWAKNCHDATICTDYVKLDYTPIPVGGVWVPINKFELLAPWIGLTSLITVAAVSVVYVKHRKKKQN